MNAHIIKCGNEYTVEVLEWMSNVISHFTGYVTTFVYLLLLMLTNTCLFLTHVRKRSSLDLGTGKQKTEIYCYFISWLTCSPFGMYI